MFLRLGGLVITSAGPYMKRDGKGVRGRKECQIDLLIQARRTICIVEIKRRCEIGREIIEEVDNSKLSERERFWIKELNATNPSIGYNLSKGGDGSQKFEDEEILWYYNNSN